MANRPLETFKFPGVPDTFIIPKSIISSEIEVTSDNYATLSPIPAQFVIP